MRLKSKKFEDMTVNRRRMARTSDVGRHSGVRKSDNKFIVESGRVMISSSVC